MIVINTENIVIGYGYDIQRVNEQGEVGLIKVQLEENGGYYYIGTDDRDDYQIINIDVPDIYKIWKYEDNTFIEITVEE